MDTKFLAQGFSLSNSSFPSVSSSITSSESLSRFLWFVSFFTFSEEDALRVFEGKAELFLPVLLIVNSDFSLLVLGALPAYQVEYDFCAYVKFLDYRREWRL